MVINIPSLGDEGDDFLTLFDIVKKARNAEYDVKCEFSSCNLLKPNAVALLGGMARQVQSQGKKIEFVWPTLKCASIRKVLCQNGFYSFFGETSSESLQNTIPYREDVNMNMNSIMDYLTDYWIGRGWVHVSLELRNAIVGKVWEIYNNAFEHSDTEIGVFSCGEHIGDDLILTVIDFGKGIPNKVRDFFSGEPRIRDFDSTVFTKWAFQRGNSTRMNEGVARGLGLDFLKEFIMLNHGKLEIYSNDCYVIIDDTGIKYNLLENSFEGTVVHITLRCDENLYKFKHELNPQYYT